MNVILFFHSQQLVHVIDWLSDWWYREKYLKQAAMFKKMQSCTYIPVILCNIREFLYNDA